MGDLPDFRVTPEPFQKTAVDYAGLVLLKRYNAQERVQFIWNLSRASHQIHSCQYSSGSQTDVEEYWKCWPTMEQHFTAVHPGSDGKIQVVDVTSNEHTYRRPVTKLSKLPSTERSLGKGSYMAFIHLNSFYGNQWC